MALYTLRYNISLNVFTQFKVLKEVAEARFSFLKFQIAVVICDYQTIRVISGVTYYTLLNGRISHRQTPLHPSLHPLPFLTRNSTINFNNSKIYAERE